LPATKSGLARLASGFVSSVPAKAAGIDPQKINEKTNNNDRKVVMGISMFKVLERRQRRFVLMQNS